MSWGVYTVSLAADVESRVDALAPSYPLEPEGQEQLKAAKEAAKAMIGSGALGAPDGFTVALSGHSNPGHTSPGSPECIGISINQCLATAVEQYDAQQKSALEAEQ